ncbi:adhesin, partial [Salmonella enterica subsp. enterica]|nr:adhesin [Salmonella enterica subsp. enterica serovar Typhimurium]
NGFALGNNARAGFDENNQLIGLDNDQAFGSNARAYGGSSMAFGNNAKASKGGAIAMGNGSQSRGDWGVAIGNGAKALAQGARAIGANSTADATNAAAMGWDSVASGEASIAIGETAKATAGNSIAMSKAAIAAADDSIAIGKNASVDANQQRSIALGANSKTDNVVSTPNQLVNGLWYKNYAGGSADSTLSVGSDTLKRTITNVAAGRVNAQSTDAINGSQLYGVANTLGNLASTTKGLLGGNAALDPDTGNLSMSNIGNTGKGTIHDAIKFNKDTIDKGLNFAGDTGAVSNRQLGDTVTVKGGATGTLSDGNIGVESDGNGTLNVKLAKTLTGLDSVTAGNTKIDNGGLTVGGKTYVSPTGLNANNQKITNVANGSAPNDAVNYSQLQAAIGGTAKASTVKAKDANVTVTESTNAAGGKEYTVGLGNKITVGTAHPVTVDGDAGHVTGLTNIDWDVDNPVAESGRGATE